MFQPCGESAQSALSCSQYDFRDGILPWGVTPEGPVQWGKEADGSSYLYLPPGSTMKLNVDLKSNENGQLINQYSVIMDIRVCVFCCVGSSLL